MNKKILIVLVLIFALHDVYAQTNNIKLLAINEDNNQGSIVDLTLDVTSGSGRVFLETYPLSQIDTQISLRIAKTIACQTANYYCLDKDFMYSVMSNSPVIAGPSAGAAMTILTMSSLENKKLDPSTVITGTINSGGVIGIVGGVKEKIEAAAMANMKRVLIPQGEPNATDMIEYGKKINVSVIEVSNIDDAYQIFTNQTKEYLPLVVNPTYEEIMERIDTTICNRTKQLTAQANTHNLSEQDKELIESALNLSNEAENFTTDNEFYSSASKCFGANVYLEEALLSSQNLSVDEQAKMKNDTEIRIDNFEKAINNTKIDNLGSLEAIMIVQERLRDARSNLEYGNTSLYDLAYANERIYSAYTWEQFIGYPGKPIDQSKMKNSCIQKIQEVNELYSYVSLYVPSLMEESKEGLNEAQSYLNTRDYASCLFEVSKTEADIDTPLGALYISDSNVDSLVQSKILAAQKAIQKQIAQNNFPILGYSYYEYATTLKDNDKYTALLYAEYAIELSNLNIYFPQQKPFSINVNQQEFMVLIIGVIIGISFAFIFKKRTRKRIKLRRK